MLSLKAPPTFNADVVLDTPSGTITLGVTFRHFTRTAYKAFLAELPQLDDIEAVMRIAVDWNAEQIEAGAEFNRDNVAALLDNYATAGRTIIETHGLRLLGVKHG